MEEEIREQEVAKQEPVKVETEEQEQVKVEKEVRKKEISKSSKKRILLIIFLIFGVWFCINAFQQRFDRLEQKMDDVNMRIHAIDNNNIVNELHSVLEKQAAVLISSDWDLKMMEKETKKVELTMSVVPKEYIAGMEVIFYADCSDGTKVSVKGEENGSMKFIGKTEIPFCDGVDMRVTMQKGEVIQIEEIGSDQVRGKFVLDVDGSFTGEYGYRGGVVNTDGKVSVDLRSYYEENLRSMKKLEVVISIDEKEWKRLPVKLDQDGESYNEISYFVYVNESIPYNTGQALRMTIEGKDEYGFRYRKIVMQTRFKENGESVEEWQFKPETEVY